MALHLGYPHPDYLLQALTASQLNGWLQYNAIEPFGEIRSEIRHGQSMALSANINRDHDKHPSPFNATDFMNFYDRAQEAEPQATVDELESYAKRLFGA